MLVALAGVAHRCVRAHRARQPCVRPGARPQRWPRVLLWSR